MTDRSHETVVDLGSEAEAFSPEELAQLHGDAAPVETDGETKTQDEISAPDKQDDEPTDDQSDKPRDARSDTVPHQALHAEREEHKKTKAALREMQDYQKQIIDKLTEQRGRTVDAERPKPPAKEDDPFLYLEHQNEQLRQQVAAMQGGLQQQTQQSAQRQQMIDAWTGYINELNGTAKDIPDFQNAAAHLKQTAVLLLREQGMADQQINQELTNREWALAQQARAMNISPAQMIYFVAQQHGYKPASTPAQNNNAASAASEKIDKLGQAQAANVSLSKTGGAGNGELTLKDLAAMPGEDLEQLAIKDPALFEKLAVS